MKSNTKKKPVCSSCRKGISGRGKSTLCKECYLKQLHGARYESNKGYVFVYAPDHPNASGSYYQEHRLVMEKHIGRILRPKEVVHHINGKANDNRIENLKLYKDSAEHLKTVHQGCNRKDVDYVTKEWLTNEYISKQKTIAEIAKEIGYVSTKWVRARLLLYNIPRRKSTPRKHKRLKRDGFGRFVPEVKREEMAVIDESDEIARLQALLAGQQAPKAKAK